MKRLSVTILLLSLLTACEAVVELNTGFRQLYDSDNEQIKGRVQVAVSSCGDRENPQRDSESVTESRERIPKIFKGAEYAGCKEVNYSSFAFFDIPVAVNPSNPDDDSDTRIKLLSSPEKPLEISIPSSVQSGLENLKRESFGLNSLELKLNLTLNNDTGKEQKVRVLSAYVDQKPVVNEEISVQPGNSVQISLADVATDYALQKGSAVVFLAPEKPKPEQKSCLGFF